MGTEGHQPQSGTSKSSSTPARILEMSSIFDRVLDASNSSDFNQILNITPSGHLQTIHYVIKDTSPSQERQNHHHLQQEFLKCHQSLIGFLMPSNSLDFNQILNITPSGHLQTIHNFIKETNPSQEC